MYIADSDGIYIYTTGTPTSVGGFMTVQKHENLIDYDALHRMYTGFSQPRTRFPSDSTPILTHLKQFWQQKNNVDI